MRIILITLALCLACVSNCFGESMKASYYSVESLKTEGTWKYSHGIMANGKPFRDEGMTCAAGKQYKLGRKLLITNQDNGKSVVVTVTDRVNKRFYTTRVDLSRGAFMKLAPLSKGLINVDVDTIK